MRSVRLTAIDKMIFHQFLRVFLISIACSSFMVECKDSLHIGMMQPLTGGYSNEAGLTYLKFAEMAIRDINARDDILADYELKSSVYDTQVS